MLLKSASLRGRQVWGRRSERQAGDVTPEMALTDEFTCGQERPAFQEEKQRVPKAWTQEAPGSGGSAFVGKEFTPGNGTEGLLLSQTRGGRNSFYTPRKTSCRSSGALVKRNPGMSHTPTAQLEGDVNLQGGWLTLTLLKPCVDLSGCWFRKGKQGAVDKARP